MKFVFQGADSFTTNVEELRDNGVTRFDISIEFGKACIPTPVTIVFYTPMIDTDAIWSPMGTNFDVVPNWRPHACESRLTGKMPLISLVAADGQNRITASLSDGPGRKFCVSDFRQSQEFLVENTHYLAYFPCPPSPQRGAAVCAPGRREYRHSPPGNTSPRELASLPVGEHDLQLAEHQIPVLTPGMPVFHDAL